MKNMRVTAHTISANKIISVFVFAPRMPSDTVVSVVESVATACDCGKVSCAHIPFAQSYIDHETQKQYTVHCHSNGVPLLQQ